VNDVEAADRLRQIIGGKAAVAVIGRRFAA
jgi:hypothetical protein